MANATPLEPADQFSRRESKAPGVAHRGGPGNASNVALFGNTPNDGIMGFRNFVPHYLDFHDDDDVDVTNRWTLSNIGGVAGAFDKLDDAPQGLGILDVGGVTVSHGVQIQHNAVGRGGYLYYPMAGESHIVSWEARGLIDFALDSDWFVGISETEDPFMSVGAVPAGDNYMGFLHIQDETTVRLIQCGTANANGVYVPAIRTLWTPEDGMDTKRRLGLRIENHEDLFWYVDGVLVGRARVGQDIGGVTVTTFATGMCHTFVLINNSVGGANQTTATIDYVCSQVTRV